MKTQKLCYVLLALFVPLVMVVYGIILRSAFHGKWADSGQFGDSFGALNSLFTGFAFAAVLVTLIQQAKQIKETKEDVEEWRQLANEKFKLDLFDKRFAVYESTRSFLNTAVGDVKNEDLSNYARDKQVAVFLFGQDIVAHLETLYKKASTLKTAEDLSRPGVIEFKQDLLNELDRLNNIFDPYLKLRGTERLNKI